MPLSHSPLTGGGKELTQLSHHGAAEVFGGTDGYAVSIVPRDVMADANGQKLRVPIAFDPLDDLTQMVFKIVMRIGGERAVIHRCTI